MRLADLLRRPRQWWQPPAAAVPRLARNGSCRKRRTDAGRVSPDRQRVAECFCHKPLNA